jgi:hypothetical protein
METVKSKIGFALLSALLLCACSNNQNEQNEDKDSTNIVSTADKSEPTKGLFFGVPGKIFKRICKLVRVIQFFYYRIP